MTSGVTAKDSALGTSHPEGDVPVNHARRVREVPARNGMPSDSASDESPVSPATSSVRTLILGIDYDGRIVQHDRIAPQILARKPDELLGAQLSELTAGTQANASSSRGVDGNATAGGPGQVNAAISGLLEAIRSDREGSAMLTIDTRDGPEAEAVVTVHPMRASGTSLAALALLRIPVPKQERFVDPAVMRKHMLDDTFTRIGDTLDIDHVARKLMDALVPSFCNTGELLLLESLVGNEEMPAHGPDGSHQLRRITTLTNPRRTWGKASPKPRSRRPGV